MSHWIAITSNEYIFAAKSVHGLAALQIENTGSGIGMLLKDLGGPFQNIKDLPILSGIFSDSGLRRLDAFMLEKGFRTKYRSSFQRSKSLYLVRAYEYPDHWEAESLDSRMEKLVRIRLQLKEMGHKQQDMMVFSFWPDTILIKETGDPREVAEHLKLDRADLCAKVLMIQGSHEADPGAAPYSCNPFFLQGFSTMASGENTASETNRAFLTAREHPGYSTCAPNAETFTHLLHYTVSQLNFGIEAYKHILTPLEGNHLASHPDNTFLKHLKQTCRQMIIDGPNCIVGCLPDNTLFMAQDRKKRCPGVIGGAPGCYAFSSDPCGLDTVLPDRDKSRDIQPMHLDTIAVGPGAAKLHIHRQTDPLLIN